MQNFCKKNSIESFDFAEEKVDFAEFKKFCREIFLQNLQNLCNTDFNFPSLLQAFHFNFANIASNLSLQLLVGFGLEKVIGTGHIILFYALCGVGGKAGSCY